MTDQPASNRAELAVDFSALAEALAACTASWWQRRIAPDAQRHGESDDAAVPRVPTPLHSGQHGDTIH